MGWAPARKKGFRNLIPDLSFQPHPQLQESLKSIPAGARVADLGAGGRRATPETICVDMAHLSGTDVVADVHCLPFATGAFDCVICTGTLEHVREPNVVIGEISRVLREGGLVHIEIPFMQPYHADPDDFHRWTLAGLSTTLEARGFRKIRAGVHIGPASSLAIILQDFFSLFAPGETLRKVVRVGMQFLLFWLKYLDYFLIRHRQAHKVASGCYFVGTKNSCTVATRQN